MTKNKRIVERPWATRRNGRWVIRTESLVESLKKAEVADIDGQRVGTKTLVRLLRLLPGDYCRVKADGNLDIETVEMVPRRGKQVSFRKPKHYYNSFRLFDGAWVPKYAPYGVVVIKPRKF